MPTFPAWNLTSDSSSWPSGLAIVVDETTAVKVAGFGDDVVGAALAGPLPGDSRLGRDRDLDESDQPVLIDLRQVLMTSLQTALDRLDLDEFGDKVTTIRVPLL